MSVDNMSNFNPEGVGFKALPRESEVVEGSAAVYRFQTRNWVVISSPFQKQREIMFCHSQISLLKVSDLRHLLMILLQP